MKTTATDGVSPNAGLAAAFGAHLIWGLLPLYFKLIAFASALEVLAQRVLWSIPAILAAVALTGGFMQTRKAVFAPGMFRLLALSSILIGCNWGLYVWAVSNAHVIEASLAYFVTPLINVAFGVLFFGERLTRPQLAALSLAAAGVALQTVGVGAFPWVGLGLCASWSLYALVRKYASVPAAGGLLVETMLLSPLAVAGLVFLATARPQDVAMGDSLSYTLLLAASGLVTATPLILFTFSARRLRFSTLGVIQFSSPTLQFLIGAAYGEPVTPLRLMGFALIWVGLAAYSWDAIIRDRARSALAASSGERST